MHPKETENKLLVNKLTILQKITIFDINVLKKFYIRRYI